MVTLGWIPDRPLSAIPAFAGMADRETASGRQPTHGRHSTARRPRHRCRRREQSAVETLRQRGIGNRVECVDRARIAVQVDGHARRDEPARIVEIFRSEEHTSELQSLMRLSYAVLCLKKKKQKTTTPQIT